MLTRPRPVMPYWPAYPEPQRSIIEQAYRDDDAKWQREYLTTGLIIIAAHVAVAAGFFVLVGVIFG